MEKNYESAAGIGILYLIIMSIAKSPLIAIMYGVGELIIARLFGELSKRCYNAFFIGESHDKEGAFFSVISMSSYIAAVAICAIVITSTATNGGLARIIKSGSTQINQVATTAGSIGTPVKHATTIADALSESAGIFEQTGNELLDSVSLLDY